MRAVFITYAPPTKSQRWVNHELWWVPWAPPRLRIADHALTPFPPTSFLVRHRTCQKLHGVGSRGWKERVSLRQQSSLGLASCRLIGSPRAGLNALCDARWNLDAS